MRLVDRRLPVSHPRTLALPMVNVLHPQPQLPPAPAPPPPLVLVPLAVHNLLDQPGGLRGWPLKEPHDLRPLPAARRELNIVAHCALATVMGSPNVVMFWQREKLESAYYVELVGWPDDVEFVSPGYMRSIRKVKRIRAAFERGTIRFVRLTPAELGRRRLQRATAAHARRAVQHSAHLKSVSQWRAGLAVKKAKAVEEIDEIEEAIWSDDE